jgi:hypothetical protein
VCELRVSSIPGVIRGQELRRNAWMFLAVSILKMEKHEGNPAQPSLVKSHPNTQVRDHKPWLPD